MLGHPAAFLIRHWAADLSWGFLKVAVQPVFSPDPSLATEQTQPQTILHPPAQPWANGRCPAKFHTIGGNRGSVAHLVSVVSLMLTLL